MNRSIIVRLMACFIACSVYGQSVWAQEPAENPAPSEQTPAEPESGSETPPPPPTEGSGESGETTPSREPAPPEPAPTVAPEPDAPSGRGDAGAYTLDTIAVEASALDLSRVGGSAQVLDQVQLERFEYDDPQRVLQQVPGVYVRTEDGFGLRPNIGMRGVSSDRSSKVTLMEDGILLAPAPYSAPAAYFFPLITRMTSVEVFKGPGSIKYGPNTVGGAINFVTRAVPDRAYGELDLAAGQYETGKAHAFWGVGNEHVGLLLEGVHLQSGGFKHIDGGGDTGFDKNEFMVKSYYGFDSGRGVHQQFDLKLGYADEDSDETYLGLTQADFRDDSLRRYAASRNDHMRWHRTQVELSHLAVLSESLKLRTTAYRHDFSRVWRRLDGLSGGVSLHDLLQDPTSAQHAVLYAVLTGQEDSSGEDQTLLVATNDRVFVSQGIQTVAELELKHGWLGQRIEAGARLHYDSIVRHHSQRGYLMQNAVLVPTDAPAQRTTRNKAETTALALHALDELSLGANWVLTPGVRMELIQTRYTDYLADRTQDDSQSVIIPGVGTVYRALSWLSVLGGVHRGFSPVSPGQAKGTKPEKSVNYEAGVRAAHEGTRGELIGFYNDYTNLTSECEQSNGCSEAQTGTQFSGGAVDVYGLEASVGQEMPGPFGVTLRGDANYTLTQSSFRHSFRSDNPLFGAVEKGDKLPYVPVHQGSLSVGVVGKAWQLNVITTYVGAMRDQASQGPIRSGEGTDAYAVVDVAADYDVSEFDRFYAKIDNLFDADYIASRRPFGARPGKPFMFLVGYKHRFGQ